MKQLINNNRRSNKTNNINNDIRRKPDTKFFSKTTKKFPSIEYYSHTVKVKVHLYGNILYRVSGRMAMNYYHTTKSLNIFILHA